jgi:hypothetical protein
MVHGRGRNHRNVTLDIISRKFTQVHEPKHEKPLKMELTEEERKRVVRDFIELFDRPPSQKEKEELFIEERKIKEGKTNGKECNT